MISRAAGSIAGMVRGAAAGAFDGWFGPGAPLRAIAPPDTAGRGFDYGFGVNLNYTPRQELGQESVGFATLRRLASPDQGGLDLLRLAIETRKDQMAAQKWQLRGRKKDDDGGTKAREFEIFLRHPDGVSTFRTWARQLIEDHLVIDAVAIYPRVASGRPLFEIVDGATIKRVIDDGARTPLPPLPAYQQVLKGVPAVDYTTKELGYYPYNLRSNRLYGMSRVEQVLGIVSIALNRQLSIASYYTDGNVPDAFIGVPENWNPDQIRQFQTYFDALLNGNIEERRKARFIPGGMNITFAKPDLLKDEFDEWLGRVICWAFSLSPEALVKQTNRATAETAKEGAKEEGLEPLKLWLKDVVDDLLERAGAPDLELAYIDEEIIDPLVKAQVIQIFGGNKAIADLNECRALAGLPPASPEQEEKLRPPAPDFSVAGNGNGFPPKPGEKLDPKKDPKFLGAGDPKDGAPNDTKDEGNPTDKAEKRHSAGRLLPGLQPNGKLDAKTERAVRRAAAKSLDLIRRAVVAAAKKGKAGKLAKGDVSDDDLQRILGSLSKDQLQALRSAIEDAVAQYASERASAAMFAVEGLVPGDFESLLEQANRDAVAWASDRAGELVTEVSDTTIEGIRDIVTGAIDDGLTNSELADELSAAYEFSEARSMLIARTETSFAENAGTLIGWRASGCVAGKVWLVGDAEVCEDCDALDGVEVPLDADFPDDGGDGPPLHPNCRCSLAPVVIERETADVGEE
jgi:SPP1 gp7 family putative phage head morphogenesis protein